MVSTARSVAYTAPAPPSCFAETLLDEGDAGERITDDVFAALDVARRVAA